MVIAYHIIMTAYGFWLPNDPRGSWSDFVRQWELLAHGPATKTNLRRSLARDTHVERAIRYVENNPIKDGKRAQRWSFVTPWVRPQSGPMLVEPRLADPLAGRFAARKRGD